LDHVGRVRAYYDDLRSSDAADVARHFNADAVHYYTRRDPDHTSARIAEYAALAVQHLNAIWRLVHLAGEADGPVAIEWSMEFDSPKTGERMLDRGAEFFEFDDEGLITEVRAYYNERGGDLRGFDHAARGHSVLEPRADRSST
jgi:nuclear transport factor 2 (NTF2) superfamily protein